MISSYAPAVFKTKKHNSKMSDFPSKVSPQSIASGILEKGKLNATRHMQRYR
jgi:hypothetical protein